MQAWHDLPEAKNLKPGEVVHGRAGDEDVLVVSHSGELRAFINRCGHMNAPLDLGTFKSGVLKCPQHSAVFDADRRGARAARPLHAGDGRTSSGVSGSDGEEGSDVRTDGEPPADPAPGRVHQRQRMRVRLSPFARDFCDPFLLESGRVGAPAMESRSAMDSRWGPVTTADPPEFTHSWRVSRVTCSLRAALHRHSWSTWSWRRRTCATPTMESASRSTA